MKTPPTHSTGMVREGQICFSPAQKKIIDSYLQDHENQYIRMTLSEPSKTRSSRQNRFYWGVVLTMIAAETKETTEELHEFFSSLFLPRTFRSVGNTEMEVQKSTTTLSTMEFEDYQEHIRKFAIEKLDMVIPFPNEVEIPEYS